MYQPLPILISFKPDFDNERKKEKKGWNAKKVRAGTNNLGAQSTAD